MLQASKKFSGTILKAVLGQSINNFDYNSEVLVSGFILTSYIDCKYRFIIYTVIGV